MRIVGWIVIIVMLGLAVLFLGIDARDWVVTGTWKTAPLGQRWFEVHRESLLLLQPAIERHIWPPLWSPVQWLLERPAWLVPGVIAFVLLLVKAVRRR